MYVIEWCICYWMKERERNYYSLFVIQFVFLMLFRQLSFLMLLYIFFYFTVVLFIVVLYCYFVFVMLYFCNLCMVMCRGVCLQAPVLYYNPVILTKLIKVLKYQLMENHAILCDQQTVMAPISEQLSKRCLIHLDCQYGCIFAITTQRLDGEGS